jgi:hypothetical protein
MAIVLSYRPNGSVIALSFPARLSAFTKWRRLVLIIDLVQSSRIRILFCHSQLPPTKVCVEEVPLPS